MNEEQAAQQGAPETKPAPSGMRHVGVIAGINASVMLLAGDAEVAERWRGLENAEDDYGTGSDWERCWRALEDDHPDDISAAVAFDGGELLAFQIYEGGLVDAYRAGDSLVLVELTYTSVGDSVRADAGFLDYVASPFSGRMFDSGSFIVRSGAIAILPATLAGDGAITVLPAAGPAEARLPLHEPGPAGERGLATRLPAGRYRIRVEEFVKRSWGSASRAVIEPCQDAVVP